MIKPGEIQALARENGVRDQQIEKDYILSWILQGISNHEELSNNLIFKGGTVLKKVYFKNYRFSEDLDFTISKQLKTSDVIMNGFQQVFAFIKEEVNIPLEIKEFIVNQGSSINFMIAYNGPLGGSGLTKKVKVDISTEEKVLFTPQRKEVLLSYSDQTKHKLRCYTLEEILIEKMRSIIQRMQARDFYDIWYLLEIHGLKMELLWSDFEHKCEAKSIDPDLFHAKLEQRLPQYKRRWESSLSNQIHQLPEFEHVKRAVNRYFRKS